MIRRLSSSGELHRVSRLRGTLLFLAPFLASACVHTLPPPPKDYVDRDLGGYIDSKVWSYKHAYVDPTISTPEEEDLVVVFLPKKPKKDCDKGAHEQPGMATVMVSVPNSTEAVMLKRGTPRALQFHFERKGKQWVTTAKSGKAKLTSIGPGKVRGKLVARYSNGLWVAGNFEAVVCEYGEMQRRDEEE